MRNAVEKMEELVDLLWLRLAQCYTAFVVVSLTMALSGLDPIWLPLAALTCVPWLVCAIKLQRQIWLVKRRNKSFPDW